MKTACFLICSFLTFAGVSQAAERERGRGAVLEKLSPEARAAMREVYMEMRGAGRELQQRSNELRQELQALVLSGKVEEQAIRAKVREMSEIEADATILRARAVARLKAAGVPDEVLAMIGSRSGSGGLNGGESRGAMTARRGAIGDRARGFGRGAREASLPADEIGRKDGRPEFDE